MLYPFAETTECDFKRELETKKPKSWLKSVSAFANGIGGRLVFGIDDMGEVVGLTDVQKNAEVISDLIKTRIIPNTYTAIYSYCGKSSGKEYFSFDY